MTLHPPTILALLAELGVLVATVALTLAHWHALTVVIAMLVIATRQHALFILYHDAVHYNVARNRRVNDLVTNLFIGVPQLVPVQLYRRLHLAHHARLGGADDPERLLLYRDQPWRYRALPLRALLRQLLGDLLLLNNVRTLRHFARELRDPDSRLALPPVERPPELWATIALWGGALAAWLAMDSASALRFALLWFVPLLTLTQALQKVRSFAEHGADGAELTHSWRPGLLGRLTLWPYHINYHREHHQQPRVPWYRLPATFPGVVQRRGAMLGRLLWNGRW